MRAHSCFDGANDHPLQTTHHKYSNGSTLSKFDYTYDAVGNILTWRQQADSTAVLWEYRYVSADQLVVAVKKGTDPQQVLRLADLRDGARVASKGVLHLRRNERWRNWEDFSAALASKVEPYIVAANSLEARCQCGFSIVQSRTASQSEVMSC